VHLLPCSQPIGLLEPAPRTALREDSADERWDGFWSVTDEGYYARCTTIEGESWYRLVDQPNVARPGRREARVLTLRRRNGDTVRQMVVLYSGTGRRPIIVGTSRRRARATAEAR
jgi:hypothetical protein